MSGAATLLALATLTLTAHAQQYWRTDGATGQVWTGPNWGSSTNGPFTTAYVANSDAQFTANSSLTFATVSIGNVTVSDGTTVTITAGGTLSTNNAVRTFTIGTGSLLTWQSQPVSSGSASGFIKSGTGMWDLGAQSNLYTGGFTLNAGTVIVSGNNGFGGSGTLTLNGGTVQSSGTRAFANPSIIVGGNFTNTGTGNATYSGTVALGGATRTITNSTTSGSRIYSGVISGSNGSGLVFGGTGAGPTYIGNAGNTFTGTITVNGGEVGFASDGALGNTANSIVVDGGRITSASTAGGAVTATWSSTRSIQVGDTAGTSISVQSGAGDLTYNGVISDVSGKTGAWAKQGGGILRLGGVSTYSGNTSINNGTVQLTLGDNRLPVGTTISVGQAASTNVGALDLGGFNQTVAGLNSTTGTNTGTSNSGSNINTVTTSTGTATLTLSGTGTYAYGDATTQNTGVITGAIAVSKTSGGTQTFGGANSYTGGTTISGGTLLVNGVGTAGTSSGTGTGTVSVNGGTLGGTGRISGAVTVTSGATIQGGAGAASGALTLSSPLTLNGGSIIQLALGASGLHSTLATAGANFDANQTFTFLPTGAQTGVYDNIITGLTADPGTESQWVITNGGFTGTFTYDGANIDLNVTAVPEPGTILGGLLLVGVSGWSQRRRLRACTAMIGRVLPT